MNSDWPFFVLQGSTPYKVISSGPNGFLVLDMIDGAIDSISPPSFHDEYVDDAIWPGIWDGNSNYFTVVNRNRPSLRYTFYFDSNYNLHRDDGPAQIIDDGRNIRKVFWLDGKQYESAEKWFESLDDKKKAAFNMDEIL